MQSLATHLFRSALKRYPVWAVWAHAVLMLALTWLAFALYGGEP